MPIRTAGRSRRWLPVTATAAALVGGPLAPAAPAVAAPIATVRCPAQNLQTAIDDARPGSTLRVTGTCTGNFTITKNLTLIGLGATLDGGGTGTVVTVLAGVRAQLTALTITHGGRPATGYGGGIYNDGGTVTLTRSTVRDNVAGQGGGIYNSIGGTVRSNLSQVRDNTADTGGGIFNFGTMTLTGSAVTGNTSKTFGGGIFNIFASLRLNLSQVRDNTATNGGGIYNEGGPMQLDLSQVRSNVASGNGGGIYTRGEATLTRSAVTRNTARDGGGIYNRSVVRLILSRVFANTPNNCAPPGSVPGCTG
ncbi:hypothetical protein AB0G55_19460 [Streptomyces toyocaensis]|uniref:hypothetical protein n=1 Tax=Streptomyces toyocaensis TaxID=55952 RepID=UPI0012FF313D|nr:hypothetical protein [Streptomyces toyocaensis]